MSSRDWIFNDYDSERYPIQIKLTTEQRVFAEELALQREEDLSELIIFLLRQEYSKIYEKDLEDWWVNSLKD